MKPASAMFWMSESWNLRPQSPSLGASSMFDRLMHLPSASAVPVVGLAAAIGVKALWAGVGVGVGLDVGLGEGEGDGDGAGVTEIGAPLLLPPPHAPTASSAAA